MNISNEVLDVLSNAETTGNALVLTGQLARPLYVATNKVLELAGGKWNKKAKAHLFNGDAAEIMDRIILTGKVTDKQQELGYFPTPEPVIERLLDLADIQPEMLVLEPSAGQGAIAAAIVPITERLDCFEIDADNVEVLQKVTFRHLQVDFLTLPPYALYDRVVMNPPFAKQADIRHVLHAFKFLKPGGRLVSVMSAGVEFRTNKLTTDFRQFVAAHNGTIEKLPEGSFSASGTDISTLIVTMDA